MCCDTRTRVAARLCELAGTHGRHVNGDVRLAVHITREDLGRMTGTSRQSVNKALAYVGRKG